MTKLIGYNIQDIAAGLRILANNMEAANEKCKNAGDKWSSWQQAADQLADMLCKTGDNQTMYLKASYYMTKTGYGPDEIKLFGDKLQLWKFFLENKDFYLHNWMQLVVRTSEDELKKANLGEIYELFLHIFNPKNKCIPLLSIISKPLTATQKQHYSAKMKDFLKEKDIGKASLLYQEFSCHILSSQDLYISTLEDNKNFIQLLLASINSEADAGVRTYVLNLIVNNDMQLPPDLINDLYVGLIALLPSLKKNSAVESYVCSTLKTILIRKNIKPGSDDATQVTNVIKQSNLSEYNTIDLLKLVEANQQPHTDFGNDIIAALTQQSLLNFLSKDYEEVVSMDIFKPGDQLLYGPTTLDDGYLYEKNKLETHLNFQQKDQPVDSIELYQTDPRTNVKVERSHYTMVSKDILNPLLNELNKLLDPKNNDNQQLMQEAAFNLAEFILNVPLNLYTPSPFRFDCITDIRSLGKYYSSLASIKEIFMIFAGKQGPVKAKQLLTDSLLGKLDGLHKYMYLLMQESMFKPNLIPSFIGYIEKNKEQMRQFFAKEYEIKGSKCNLITACMYAMRKAYMLSDIKAYTKLLIIMLDNVDLDTLLTFKNNTNDSIFHLLIWTIYELVAKNSNGNDLEVEIKTLKTKLETLAQAAAKGKMSFGKNTNGETILYPELSSDFRGNPALQNILAIQIEINSMVKTLVNEEQDSNAKQKENLAQKQKSSMTQRQLLQLKTQQETQQQNAVIKLINSVPVDLSKPENYKLASVEQIKIHLLYSEIKQNIGSLLTTIIHTQSKGAIVDCFIQCKFNEIIDCLIKNTDKAYALLLDSDNSYAYLSNLCDKINESIALGVIELGKLKKLITSFLISLTKNYIEQDFKEMKILPANFLDIVQRLGCNVEKAEVDAIMHTIQSLAQDAKNDQITIRKKIISGLFTKLLPNLDGIKQQKLEQIQEIGPVEGQKLQACSADSIENYFIQNVIKIKPENIENLNALFAKFNTLELNKILIISDGLSPFNQTFFEISKAIKANIPSAKLDEIVQNLDQKIGQNKTSEITLQELLDLCTQFLEIYTSNIDQKSLFLKTAKYIKIMQESLQKYPDKEKENFKELLIEKCYKRSQAAVTFLTKDAEYDDYRLHEIDTRKREAAEILIEHIPGQYEITDWSRFIMLCEQLLLEEALTEETRKFINSVITDHSYVKDINKYNDFIQLLQNSAIKIEFKDMQYAYPKAFKRVFSDGKNEVNSYILMRKYINKSEMYNDLHEKEYLEVVKDKIILSLNKYDELDVNNKSMYLINLFNGTDSVAKLTSQSKQMKFFSQYSKTRTLSRLLYFLEKTTAKYLTFRPSVVTQTAKYHTTLEDIQAMLDTDEKLTLFDNNNELADGRDNEYLLFICRQVMYSADNQNFVDKCTAEINLIATILGRVTKKSFNEFLDYLFCDITRSRHKKFQSFWEAFTKCSNEQIKKEMFDMLSKAAQMHDSTHAFNLKIKQLQAYMGVAIIPHESKPPEQLKQPSSQTTTKFDNKNSENVEKEEPQKINFGGNQQQEINLGGNQEQELIFAGQSNDSEAETKVLLVQIDPNTQSYLSYCLELEYKPIQTTDQQTAEKTKQKKPKEKELDFSISDLKTDNINQIIFLLCKLTKQLHDDNANDKRRELFEDLKETLANVKQQKLLQPAKLMQTLRAANKEPQICKLARFDNGCLIMRIIQGIARFFLELFTRNNRAVIEKIEEKIDDKGNKPKIRH